MKLHENGSAEKFFSTKMKKRTVYKNTLCKRLVIKNEENAKNLAATISTQPIAIQARGSYVLLFSSQEERSDLC